MYTCRMILTRTHRTLIRGTCGLIRITPRDPFQHDLLFLQGFFRRVNWLL
ncbi:hypothetical protein CUMW_276680, partial [Citrus unshiu]